MKLTTDILHAVCLSLLIADAVLAHSQRPTVSIITSVYKGDEFIKGFLEDIIRQTIFDECELIIINANSPGNEEAIIKEYCHRYPNIRYKRLKEDPGLYGVWNLAIKKARGRYITNANIDDRRNPKSLEKQARELDKDDDIDLVYADFYVTRRANITFEEAEKDGFLVQVIKFSPEKLYTCFVGPQPMWRKSVHDRCGYFDPSYKSAGDWEFWNRMASKGCKFKKIRTISGAYFDNPVGLSSHRDPERQKRHEAENRKIRKLYQSMWSY